MTLAELESEILKLAMADIRKMQGDVIPIHAGVLAAVRELARDAERYRLLRVYRNMLCTEAAYAPPTLPEVAIAGDELDTLLAGPQGV